MVAKSYQGCPVVSDVYTINGKMYIKILDKRGNQKQVRWYSEAEYEKIYSTKIIKPQTIQEKMGFAQGFITLLQGNTYLVKDWIKEQGGRYSEIYNWYFPSEVTLPAQYPEGIVPIQLTWEQMIAAGAVESTDARKLLVESLIYPPSKSEWVGTIGERSEFCVRSLGSKTVNTQYGFMNIYDFVDEEDNVIKYLGSSHLKVEEGCHYVISATVKRHTTYHNEKQTQISYVKVKEQY